jgi:hypothetical protein
MSRLNITELSEEEIIARITAVNASGLITKTIHPGKKDAVFNFHTLTKVGDKMFSMTLDINLKPQRFVPYTFIVRTAKNEIGAACVVKVVGEPTVGFIGSNSSTLVAPLWLLSCLVTITMAAIMKW